VTTFPAGCNPQVPVSDRRYYPVYQTCVDLDVPIVANAGVPGPRVPAECQHVMHFDRVCYDFPELRIVMRHGAEPWEDLAVKLMLKWPGLHYMSSGFAPKYYPRAIIDFANTRGADKILYAGYYPAGLILERIFTEHRDVPLKDAVWPKLGQRHARVQARRWRVNPVHDHVAGRHGPTVRPFVRSRWVLVKKPARTCHGLTGPWARRALEPIAGSMKAVKSGPRRSV
jgi:hypothetical protein